jgi:hypothetical protein
MEEITEIISQSISKEDFFDKITSKKKIANSTINFKIVIDNEIKFNNDLMIVNCVFEDYIDIINNSKISLTFIDCVFKKRLFLVGKSYTNINIVRCKFHSFIAFEKLYSEKIQITQCDFQNKILTQLQDFNCKKFEFTKNISTKDFQFKPQKVEEIFLEGSESNYLITFYGSSKIIHSSIMLFNLSNNRTNFVISDFSTQKFRLFGDLKDCKLNINKGLIDNLVIDRFINFGNLIVNEIQNLSEKSIIIVNDSLLGKAQINNIDFNKFKKSFINSSNLLEIIPVNITWCKAEKFNSTNSLKEVFRQLKIVSIKNEDLLNKHYFSKLEMEKILSLQEFSFKNFNDFFILKTNKISNDFGLNWLKSLKYYLILSAIFYTTIKYCLDYKYFNADFILDDLGNFLNFINPLHQFDKVFNIENIKNTNGGLLIDGISKIINAYLLFQLISSFRKYSNK